MVTLPTTRIVEEGRRYRFGTSLCSNPTVHLPVTRILEEGRLYRFGTSLCSNAISKVAF